MDYIRDFDIKLEKEYYYAGEQINGNVVLDTIENFKLRTIRVLMRGKAHAEWKILLSGDRKNLKDDQYFVEKRQVIYGRNYPEHIPVLPRGLHKFPFSFSLPECSLPCSFESRPAFVRYYFKVTLDIPYASAPQGTKYFTVIGPHIDCMEEQYLKPIDLEDSRSTCCWCCKRGTLKLRGVLERSAYVCKETLKLRTSIDNQTDEVVRLVVTLEQHCEFFISKGVLGVNKEAKHVVFQYTGSNVKPRTKNNWYSANGLLIPPMPTTTVGICRLLQIYYILTVSLHSDKEQDIIQIQFPITIGTVPFRIPNSNQTPTIKYENSCSHVEGGLYLAPEFLLGEVYDGEEHYLREPVVLYKPLYATVDKSKDK
ncbi:hypothetical protein WA026_019866 [Henosepilachna vigintioctopunctata]|uniref:Arrestin C-terminal-like domain-containing protein n=1 Tax=Henosepilachna vigintioctopunctata TaxID=420089 RepID=A0AAW1VGE8_9CUCU